MTTAEIDGVPIHYEIDGADDAPPVLVLHGGLGIDHVLYRRSLHPLASSFRLIHFDQRANGRSVPADLATLTMERLADDAAELLDHLGLGAVDVLGHSYGGFVAQELALRHPDRVRSLVLVDTTPGQLGAGEVEGEHGQGPVPPADVLAIFEAPPPEDDDGFEQMLAAVLPAYFRHPERVDLASLTEGCVYRVGAMARGFEVLGGWSSADRLGGITAPTLVLVGRHDVVTAWPQSFRIASRITGAKVVVFTDSGHFPWLEEADRFFPLVAGFLGGDPVS